MADGPTFRHGVIVGFGGCIELIQLLLAASYGDMRAMYRDFGHVELPLLTRITSHPAWLYGVPVVGIAALIALMTVRPRSLAIYVVVAATLAAAAAATWYFPQAPIYALAGNIKP